MNVPNGQLNNNNVSLGGRANNLKGGSSASQTGDPNDTRNTWVENGHVRSRTTDGSGNNLDTKNGTIVNNRRVYTNPDGSRSSNVTGGQVQGRNDSRMQTIRPESTSGNARRSYAPSTTGKTYSQGRAVTQSQNYTPSYNKPRVVNQSNYNNNGYTRPSTSESSAPRSSIRSSSYGSSGSTYSQPRSSSSMRQTYNSSSSYSSGSSSSSGRSSSYSGSPSPSYNSSPSQSYSSPSRSSSSSSGGSYSGGGSSGGGSSSGGSSGGGGGSGSRR